MTLGPQFSLAIAGGNNLRAAAHPPQGCSCFKTQLPGLGRDQISDLVVFEMSPHILDRVEFGRIGRQSLHHELSSGGGNVGFHQQAAVNRCAIPQHEKFPAHLPLEMAQELDDLQAFDTAGVDLEVEAPPGQTADDRKAFPIEGLLQHRRLSAWRPGARPRGTCAQSAFVDEDDRSPLLASLFFNAGQVVRFQRRIAGSSRSTARRSGRWQLKPLSPNKRQTWPG